MELLAEQNLEHALVLVYLRPCATIPRMKSYRNPDTLHAPVGGYSHQVEVDAPVRWLVMAGQVGKTVEGSVPEDPITQIEVALENVRRNLETARMGVTDLVKLNWYLVGEIDTQRRLDVIAAWLHGHEPCSTLLYVAALARPVYRVEVDAWACCDLEQPG